LEVLSKECELVSAEIGGNKEVVQLHFGGGSPTFLNNEEIFQVMDIIRSHFALAPDAEISIEVDPRSTPVDKVEVLAKAGFNRMSIGVQDFDNRVQIAVNRVQPFEMTKAVLDAARANGFKSINMDLIYGLPFQSRKTFEMTLDKVIELSPDRIALYHFAHLPEHFKPPDTHQCRRPSEHAGKSRHHDGCYQAFERQRLSLHRYGPLRQGHRRTRQGSGKRYAAEKLPRLFH